MKTMLGLVLWLAWLPGGEQERGLVAYREGRYADAIAAFRAAIAAEGDSPELQWNLALACQAAGDLVGAETAAEKYAALGTAVRTDWHAGLLGAVRHAEATALVAQAGAAAASATTPPAGPGAAGATPPAAPTDPLPLLEQALAKAGQARDWFVRAAAAKPSPELQRNLERSLRLITALEQQIEAEKQRREQQQKENQDQDGDDKPQPGDDGKQQPAKEQPKDGEQQGKPEPNPDQPPSPGKENESQDPSGQPDGKPGEPKQDNQGQPASKDGKPEAGEPAAAPPEPKPQPDGGEQGQPPAGDPGSPAPAPQEPQPKPGDEPTAQATPPATPRNDAPGEGAAGRVLSPEQAQRLLERLRELDGKLKQIRGRAKTSRPVVERDW
jgi:tetratricopeptide (TPR) repeat protein